MRDYSDKIESEFLDGGIFEYMKEWETNRSAGL